MADTEQDRQLVQKVMRDIGLSDEQITLAFGDSPEGHAFMAKLRRNYALDADTILRERKRAYQKALNDYENEMAIARSEGKAEGEAIGEKRGRTEGKVDTLVELVKDGILTVADAAKRADMTAAEFRSQRKNRHPDRYTLRKFVHIQRQGT